MFHLNSSPYRLVCWRLSITLLCTISRFKQLLDVYLVLPPDLFSMQRAAGCRPAFRASRLLGFWMYVSLIDQTSIQNSTLLDTYSLLGMKYAQRYFVYVQWMYVGELSQIQGDKGCTSHGFGTESESRFPCKVDLAGRSRQWYSSATRLQRSQMDKHRKPKRGKWQRSSDKWQNASNSRIGLKEIIDTILMPNWSHMIPCDCLRFTHPCQFLEIEDKTV